MWLSAIFRRNSTRLVVNHLTRMSAGFFCVAGIDVSRMAHIRPEFHGSRLPTELLAIQGGAFDVAVEVELGRVEDCGNPPEVEDRRFKRSSLRPTRHVGSGEFWDLLRGVARPGLRAIFGEDLTRYESARFGTTCTMEAGKGRASLGCLIPRGRPELALVVDQYDGKKKVRMAVSDDEMTLSLPVTDARLYALPDWDVDEGAVTRVARRLASCTSSILAVGLTRQLHGDKHWLQVNNIHLADSPVWRMCQ
jgi:hypothetical protein